MKLVLDAQVLQTSDASRGMGLYTSSILKSLRQITAKHQQIEVAVITNSRLGNEERAVGQLKELLGELLVTCFSVPLDYKTNGNQTYSQHQQVNQRAVDELIRTTFGEEKIIYFIPALFANDIFPTFPTLPSVVKVLLFHDLIPYLYSQQYFESYNMPSCVDYCERFKDVFAADMLVTNSQTTADDLEIYFGIDKRRLVPILGSGADRHHLKPQPVKTLSSPAQRFVLMPSGDDLRKNNTRGVQAFEIAIAGMEDPPKLVITSNFSEGTRRHLQSLSNNVMFVGSVSEAELVWLMDTAEFIFFPTEYEGLGMPVIEAVTHKKRVVCSSISVFKEISPTAFVFTDPHSVQDMAEVLRHQIENPSSLAINQNEYASILRRFNWNTTAKLFVAALEGVFKVHQATTKPRMAIFAPAPDSYSAIGKYVLEAHAELSRSYDVDYYFERGQTVFNPTRLNILQHAVPSYEAVRFTDPTRYDHIMYHIGNSEFHINTILNSWRYPGTVILHDCHLNGIFDYMERGGYITSDRHTAETILSEQYADDLSSHIVTIVNRQKAVACHSKYASKAVKKAIHSDTTLEVVEHPIATPTIQLKNNKPGKVVVSFAGIISPDKGIDLVKDIASLGDSVEVRLFGFGVLGHTTEIAGLKNVTVLTNLSDLEFQNNMRDTDILINYRMRYHGETSRSALEAMRYGTAVIVKNIGWYGELPDNVVVKVDDTAELLVAIRELIDNKGKRRELSLAAINYTTTHLDMADYVRNLKKVLR